MPLTMICQRLLFPVATAGVFIASAGTLAAGSYQFLFLGHPRDDGPGEIVQREVERVDFAGFNLLLLGGDYTWIGTGTRQTVDYLDAVFDLSAPTTLAVLGNHDTSHKDYFTDVTGRPRYYAVQTNGIAFVMLDTTDDGQNILGGELQLLADTVAALTAGTHLVVVHHHLVWLADYPPLAGLRGSPLIGASSANLTGLNFFSAVYPLLVQARSKGGEVFCLAGDRTGGQAQEFHIDHTTAEGVHFLAAGLMEEAPPSLRTAIVLQHDDLAGTLTYQFRPLSELPRIADEPLVINELHYHPAPAQGDDHAFIELYNRGAAPYDLSGASFSSGVGFTFPDPTILAPGEYALVVAEPGFFSGLGIQVFAYAGSSAPNPVEPMWLRDRRRKEIDYVGYGMITPWPSPPNGGGPSLMLIDAGLDNALATSWAASDQDGGTPGRQNIPPPAPGALSIDGGVATVQWSGVAPNGWYRLDYSPSLDPPDWRPASPLTPATTVELQLSDTNAVDADQRYFRLSRWFP